MGDPMRKNNLTALLTDLRALILKSRPAYQDYLGISVEEIPEKLLAYTEAIGGGETLFTISDESFVTFSVGEQYMVGIDGEKQTVQASYYNEIPAILSFDPSAGPSSESYWIIIANGGVVIGTATGTYIGKGFSVSYPGKTIKEKKWDIKRLAYDLLPEKLLNLMDAAQSTADAAQSTADAAQTTANAAQTTANAAQTTANAAQSILGDVSTGKEQAEILLTFDKQTSGRDSFVFNGFNYYKFSEFSPAPVDVIDFSGTTANGATSSEIVDGENCRKYGLFIMVEKAGACTLPITSTDSGSFTAPSVGLYAKYKSGNDWQTAETAKFTYLCANLLVKSPTGKNFRITVDDTGTLSATEVTNTTT